MTAMRPPPAPPEDRGIAKHAAAIIVAVVIALVLWVGNSLTGLNTTVTRMSANVDQAQKSIGDLQASWGAAAKQLAEGQATDARQDARADALETEVNRVKERVRAAEGLKPLPSGFNGGP
jgi:hypothetical protein